MAKAVPTSLGSRGARRQSVDWLAGPRKRAAPVRHGLAPPKGGPGDEFLDHSTRVQAAEFPAFLYRFVSEI